MEIRRMLCSDEAEVGRLYVKSWRAGYKGLLPQDYLDGLGDGAGTANSPGCPAAL